MNVGLYVPADSVREQFPAGCAIVGREQCGGVRACWRMAPDDGRPFLDAAIEAAELLERDEGAETYGAGELIIVADIVTERRELVTHPDKAQAIADWIGFIGDPDEKVQVFTFTSDAGAIAWNITRALEFVRDRMAAQGEAIVGEIDGDELRGIVEHTERDNGHVANVDENLPGLAAIMLDTQTALVRPLVIDGCHRAARCLLLGVPFRVIFLTADENFRCLMRCPPTMQAAGFGPDGQMMIATAADN